MPYPNFHAARIKELGDFDKESFRNKTVAKGIEIIMGKLKNGDGNMTAQAYRFDRTIFTAEEAKKWLKDHNIDYISFEEATGKMMKEYISCNYEIKSLDDKGIVQFYANVFNNLDTDGDRSLPGSFAKTIKENGSRIRHYKMHDRNRMPGVVTDLKEDEVGLLVTSQLIMGTQLGRETYEEYKAIAAANKQMEHSAGLNPIQYKILGEDTVASSIREVSEWKLWEVSTLTAWGSNDKALTVSLKQMEDATREDLERELIFLKGLLNISSYTDLKLEQIEKQISFLNKLKAGQQSELSATTDRTTLEEFKKILNL
jgi:HK97 family phage prohead protease